MIKSLLGTISCSKEEFNCTGEVPPCIPKNWVCDGYPDCVDSSDEEFELCGKNLYPLCTLYLTCVCMY